jgi:tetratricopeptide (TPR) repeat protein
MSECITPSLDPGLLALARQAQHDAAVLQAEGSYALAQDLARQAEVLLGLHTPEHEDTIERCIVVCTATGLAAHGQVVEAEDMLRRALSTAEDSLGSHDPETGELVRTLGRVLQQARRLPEATACLKRALAIAEHERGHHSWEVANLYRDLADLALAGHRYDEGELLARQALDVRPVNELTGRQIENAADFFVLGSLLSAQGHHAEAQPCLRRAVTISEQASGRDSSETSTALHALAKALAATGSLDESAAAFQRAIAIKRRILGDSHPALASALHDLAVVYERCGRAADARSVWRAATEVLDVG